ncbi:hypothetical protein ACFLZ5_02085 [Thermodesulfobacteriota bacterium]
MKKYFLILFINTLLLLFLFVSAEYSYRFYRLLTGRQPYGSNSEYKPDNVIGWVPKKNFHINKKDKDAAGVEYTINYSSDKHGFRAWGDLENKPKILIIGDSVTGDSYTSNKDAYFSIVGDKLNAEIFAFGAGGYGNFQEYLILKQFADIIKPEIFILQFCTNDFHNNNIHTEKYSFVRNQKLRRPYLTEAGITYGEWSKLYTLLANHSDLFRLIDINIQKFQYKKYKGYFRPADNVLVTSLFDQSIKITDKIFNLINKELPENTLKLSFTCSTQNKEYTEAWKKISKNNNFIPLENISLAVEKAELGGKVIHYNDGSHWNILGNRIAGEQLAYEINKIIKNDNSLEIFPTL